MQLTLAEMVLNEACRIVSAAEKDVELQGRLYALGLYPGIRVEVLNVAPAGDPLQIRSGASLLSIRKSEAALIQVEPLGND